jgi:hypothetical protein
MLHKGDQNAMTNKRLYLVSWSAAIRTSRRRGWCSYIELLSTCQPGLPGDWPLYCYSRYLRAIKYVLHVFFIVKHLWFLRFSYAIKYVFHVFVIAKHL